MNYIVWTPSKSYELYHHGILGQKWGVRRYQNADGSLTDEGRKRISKYQNLDGTLNEKGQKRIKSNKDAIITKGTELYRVSSNKSDLAKGEKIYATTDKEQHEMYKQEFLPNKILKNGEAYVQKMIAKNDIILPDKKTMEKVELGLLKDKDVQRELVDSLMKKGMSRAQATEYVKPYSAGKAAAQKILGTTTAAASSVILGGAAVGMTSIGALPLGIYFGSGSVAAGATAVKIATSDSDEKRRALNAVRVSYGDKENKITNKKLEQTLKNQGYNGIKDYNDRRAYGKKATSAVIVFDSEKNLTNKTSKQVTARDYGEAYADRKIRYNKEHNIKTSIDREDYVQDGIKDFNSKRDQYIINERTKKNRDKILKEAKGK